MNWTAAYEQKQDAMWRTLLMFAALIVLTVRTGIAPRFIVACASPEPAPRNHPAIQDLSGATARSEFYIALVSLLAAVHAVALKLISTLRAAFELMKSAHALTLWRTGPAPVCKHGCRLPAKRLDSS